MKIAIAQINPRVGDFQANGKKIRRFIERAKDEGAAVVLFPELATAGYPPQDLLDYEYFERRNRDVIDDVAEASEGITVVCGFIDKNPNDYGRPYLNAAAVIQQGERVHTYVKKLLPNYDVFDEARYFEPGEEPLILEIDGLRIGFTICEDAWNHSALLDRPYKKDPLDSYKGKIDILVNLAASPFNLGRPQERVELFKNVSKRLSSAILFCNQVGGNDELIFEGCSMAINKNGALIASAKPFKEDLLIVDTEALIGSGEETTPDWPKSDSAWLFQALELGLRDYVHKVEFKSVCLGLSGGIDSSVLAAIAAKSLGNGQVLGVGLPTRFTIDESSKAAEKIASALDIQFRMFGIETLFKLYENLLAEWFHREPKSTTLENLQPRIRMAVLMAIANENRRLLLATSNKSEIATGYATLYGDTAGAIAPLGDLTKEQVYGVANYINSQSPCIPQEVIDRAPTAELKENQADQDTLPPYDILDPLVTASVVKRLGSLDLIEQDHPADWVSRFRQLHSQSEFKRRQFPPVLRVSGKAFGSGRRIPIAAVREGF